MTYLRSLPVLKETLERVSGCLVEEEVGSVVTELLDSRKWRVRMWGKVVKLGQIGHYGRDGELRPL